GLWALVPVPFVGWAKTVESHQQWLAHLRRLSATRQAYPSQASAEPPLVYNLSLQAAVARNLETYPPGHPLHVHHPVVLQPGALDPETAYRVVRGVLLAVGLALAWRFRRPWEAERRPGQRAAEWAAVCLLCALLAPVCWKQHLVVALPAAFLVVRALL